MTLETIRQKTRELHVKTRRALLRGMTVPLLVTGIAGWIVAQLNGGPVLRAIFVVAIAWSLAGQYFLNRGMWSAAQPGDAPLSTGLESYRREVERRRYLSGRFLLWSLGPVVLALAALIAPLLSLGIRKGMLLNMIPFLALLVIWLVSVFVIRMRDRRELQREIDDLNALERANGSLPASN
jgi:FtsH-binding integral membrane protein